MSTVSEMIEIAWRPPRDIPRAKRLQLDRKLPENFKYYGNWGFPIYRTYYGPESNEHWDTLLDILKRQTQLALGFLEIDSEYKHDIERLHRPYENKDEYLEELTRLKKLFLLDPREDQALLDGLDIRQLRELCESEHPEAKKTMSSGYFSFVLVADKAVLEDIARSEFIVKTLAYGWREGGLNWDWMRIPSGCLLELWHSLMMSEFHPHRILYFDGPEEDLEKYVWDGDAAASPTSWCSQVKPFSSWFKVGLKLEEDE